MHKLARQVWLTITPHADQPQEGHQAIEGLSIFLKLNVELAGEVDPATGLIVNVTTIDEKVHQLVLPLFNKHIGDDFRAGKRVDTSALCRLLYLAWETLADKFEKAALSKLTLAITPFKKISIIREDKEMIYLSEKFEFAATHRLWNPDFTEQRNFEIFGKCANASGHGHNYVAEIIVKLSADRRSLNLGSLSGLVDELFVKLVDHKNLNVDVPHFAETIPTVENIAAFAWQQLADKLGQAKLHCITIWETDKTSCSYFG